jgi:hypothetical protein
MTPNEFSNTTPEKPDWFELTNGDAPSANVTKVNKVLPALAVLVSGALIATGAFFANASSDQVQTTPVGQTSASPAATVDVTPAPTPAATVDVTPAANPQGGNQATPQASPTIKSASATPTPPIMVPPTGGGGDDEEDEGDDHEGRKRHKEKDDD